MHGVRFQTPQSLLISSITASNHRINLVAAHTRAPYPLTLRQPRSQTLILIPSTILRSAPITVLKAPAPMKYRPSRLLLWPRPINKAPFVSFQNAEYYPHYLVRLDSVTDNVTSSVSTVHLHEYFRPLSSHSKRTIVTDWGLMYCAWSKSLICPLFFPETN